ncbi:MAG: hypothetical protein AAGG56_05505 [Pseudomonadota bacterium]
MPRNNPWPTHEDQRELDEFVFRTDGPAAGPNDDDDDDDDGGTGGTGGSDDGDWDPDSPIPYSAPSKWDAETPDGGDPDVVEVMLPMDAEFILM